MSGKLIELFPDSDEAEMREARVELEHMLRGDRVSKLMAEMVRETSRVSIVSLEQGLEAMFRAGFKCGFVAARRQR